jgi:hypothetical protein
MGSRLAVAVGIALLVSFNRALNFKACLSKPKVPNWYPTESEVRIWQKILQMTSVSKSTRRRLAKKHSKKLMDFLLSPVISVLMML